MRLESCMRFDTELFIKRLKEWKQERDKLLRELESMSELPSVNNESGVRSSDISKPAETQAVRIIDIETEVSDIDECIGVYEYAKAQLSPEEREVFERFFEPKKPIWKEIDEYTHGNYTNRIEMYRRRWKILAKLDKIIEDKFF